MHLCARSTEQTEASKKIGDVQRQVSAIRKQQDELLNPHLAGEFDFDTFAARSTEPRKREALLNLGIEACGHGRHENADVAVKAFELSQKLREKWVAADYAARRRNLEIVVLNFSLDGATLDPEWRKPFDILPNGFLCNRVGATGHQLNFFSLPRLARHRSSPRFSIEFNLQDRS